MQFRPVPRNPSFSEAPVWSRNRQASTSCAESGATSEAPVAPRDSATLSAARLVPSGRVTVGYDQANLDKAVRPQDDFYEYAVGGYLKSHPIPDDQSRWGVDTELTQRVENSLHDILESLPADATRGSNEQKLRDFYRSGMDQTRIDTDGITPLKPELGRIDAIKNMDDVQAEIAHLHASGLGAMFDFGAIPDSKNPAVVIGEADQGGLSMPNRDYYLSTDPQLSQVRGAFVDHVTKMFTLVGDDPLRARTEALEVLSLETRLAEGSLAPDELRDPQALYNPKDRHQLGELTPNFDWGRYFDRIGRPDIERINVATPAFFTKLNDLLATSTVPQWKTYLRWQVIDQMAAYLSSDLEKEDFHFKKTVLRGVTAQPDRWKRVVEKTDNFLGEALGQKFVEKNFPPEAKARVLEMIENVKAALRDKINNGWMSSESRKGALAKVDGLTVKVGYPDKWKDYSSLDVHEDVFANNVMRANAFLATELLSTIGKPVDRTVWGMTPSTVNAYYEPLTNEICFPAAILQPPYFDVNADDAANYGATGATIGHELTHGFDDEGSQYDVSGAMHPWMTASDQATFKQRADGVAHQFDEFIYDGQHENGHLVEGESIADLGGLEIAWAAFQKTTAGKRKTEPANGFTPKQLFYLNYALSWAMNMRPQDAHLMLTNNPHPLPKFRVIGPLANLPEFFQAFNVAPGDPMMRPEDKRNKLWNP